MCGHPPPVALGLDSLLCRFVWPKGWNHSRLCSVLIRDRAIDLRGPRAGRRLEPFVTHGELEARNVLQAMLVASASRDGRRADSTPEAAGTEANPRPSSLQCRSERFVSSLVRLSGERPQFDTRHG